MKKVHYKLTFSEDLYWELRRTARKNNTTVSELMRKGIQWILVSDSIKEKDGRILIEREKGAELVNVIPF